MIFYKGSYIYETFEFPEGLCIKMDYGVIDPDFVEPYLDGFERFVGSYRRSRLFDGDKLITEVIEDNPDLLTDEEEERLKEKNIEHGDVFDRIINFDDGKVAKIEYWATPQYRDKNYRMYNADYRKLILLDENNEIISEVMEENPNNYVDENVITITGSPDLIF